MAATSSLNKLLASSSLLAKSRFASSLAATNNLRAFPLSDAVDPISKPTRIRLASPLSSGIGGNVRPVWEVNRSYSTVNGLNNQGTMLRLGKHEDVKVPVKKKKSFTKICMVIKTFESKNTEEQTFPAHQNKIRLPTKRSLFTVLRSPHIDKKSREQFFLTTKKQHLVIQAERHDLAKKYFWLKRHRVMGAQFEVKFFCKTRFQLLRGRDGLNDSRESELQIENAPTLASI